MAALLITGGMVAASLGARADQPSLPLHEFIPPDPGEDVTYSATTLEGDLPAAIQTPSGLATAPDPRKAPAGDHVYAGATTDDTPDATYEPDRDTRRPHVENYDDPFSPATAPFKRLRAYDWVDADYALHVRDKALQKMSVGGSAGPGDEPFYGDLSVDLIPGQPVRIPTVGPGARILRMHVNPEVPVEMLHDGADNWFVRGTTRARVRLVVELAIARDTFGREFADVDWSVLDAIEASRTPAGDVRGAPPRGPSPSSPRGRFAGTRPTAGATGQLGGHPQAVGQVGGHPQAPGVRLHDAALAEVAQALGVSRAMRPREVVRRMVDYFRSFAPSEEPPNGRQDIYLDLALSRKGVCRHRAFAFLVTALGLGIPARMVVNEAHAWIEVFDSRLWHRIDLGGAAANLENDPDPNKPAYVPPPDPYAWPTSRDSGQDLADRNRNRPQPGQGPSGDQAGDGGAAAPSSDPANAGAGSPSPTPPGDPRLPEAEVTVGAIDGDVHRGLPLHLQGHVTGAGGPCAHLRVDVVLVARSGRSSAAPGGGSASGGSTVGSLSTDERGHYDGAGVVPRDLALGDYDLVVQTPGDAHCGAGRTK
jgi:hypothetical protein